MMLPLARLVFPSAVATFFCSFPITLSHPPCTDITHVPKATVDRPEPGCMPWIIDERINFYFNRSISVRCRRHPPTVPSCCRATTHIDCRQSNGWALFSHRVSRSSGNAFKTQFICRATSQLPFPLFKISRLKRPTIARLWPHETWLCDCHFI